MLKLGYLELNYTLELLIALEMIFIAVLALGGNLNVLQKKVLTPATVLG